MSKKLIIAAVLLVLLAGGVSGYFILNFRSGSSVAKVKGDLTYTDDSGFSFSYPKDITISDETPDDATYYTILSLTKGSEKMTITIKDAQGKEDYSGASLVGAITLGGISAKQYAKGGNLLLTVASDQGVLYLIEGFKDSGFWEDAQNIVASSFAFAGTKPTTDLGDNTIYEEEEVVE